MQIPHNYIPRDYQIPLYNALADGFKRGVAIWHRRAGKDKTFINIMTKETYKRRGSYYYYFPTYAEGRKILWEGMDRDGFPFLSHIPESERLSTNNSEMKIEMKNGSIIRIVGTDRLKIVGPNPVGCVFSEFSLQDPRAWDYIRPILAENEGWALFNFTPRGFNHAWELWEATKKNDKWFTQMLTVDDTKAIAPMVIQEERDAGMNEDLVQQEFWCSFEAALPGAYYAEQLRQARNEGRITDNVRYKDGIAVDTYWDLGMDDATAIWFGQNVGREVHFIDYYESSGEGLSHYTALLQEKATKNKWTYGRHVAPHDIEVRELGTGVTRYETARKLGLTFQIAKKPEHKEDAIEVSRNTFKICWFAETACHRGIEALSNYQKVWDDTNRVFKTRPLHNWACHGADAFQTFALGHKFSESGVDIYRPPRKEKSITWRTSRKRLVRRA